MPQTAALRIIDLQRPVADHARPVQAVEFEIVRVAAERLPADLAADAEAADVALELEFVARGQLLSDANANQRVDPIEVAGTVDRPLTDLAQPQRRHVDQSGDVEPNVGADVPVAKAGERINGRVRRAAG